MVRRRRRTSPAVWAALWVVMSCLCIATMASIAKGLGEHLSSFQVAFFRAAFGLALVLPLVLPLGMKAFRTRRPALLAGRGIAGAVGMMAGFYAVVHMPLAEATAITFTAPLFVVLLAGVFLGETVDRNRWLATIVGFLGVIFLIQPDTGAIETAAIVALIGAMAIAAVKLMLRSLAKQEQALTILLYTSVIMTLVTAAPAWMTWKTPTSAELGLLLVIGILANLGQYCMIRGYKLHEASKLAPLEYSRLIFAILLGAYVFAETPTGTMLTGAALIVFGSLYVALSKQRAFDHNGSIDDLRYMAAIANSRIS
ncbi:MAG: DMT family transporter [Geminicoccaceae bacterium]